MTERIVDDYDGKEASVARNFKSARTSVSFFASSSHAFELLTLKSFNLGFQCGDFRLCDYALLFQLRLCDGSFLRAMWQYATSCRFAGGNLFYIIAYAMWQYATSCRFASGNLFYIIAYAMWQSVKNMSSLFFNI